MPLPQLPNRKAMFFFKYDNSCLNSFTNDSISCQKTNKYYGATMITLTTMAFIFNGFSLLILTRKNSNLRFGQIKLNILILSLVETWLTGFIILFHSIGLYKKCLNAGGILTIWIDTILFYNITSLTCTRNWIVVIIACSRCEIICLPLNSKRGLKFNHHNTKVIAVIITIFSYCLSLVRLFSKEATICKDINYHIQNHTYKGYLFFEIYVFFAYQSVLPVLIVGIVSLSMSISLLSCRTSPIPAIEHHCSYYTIKKMPMKNASNRKQRKATRTILTLAFVFTLLEVPVFIIQSIIHLITNAEAMQDETLHLRLTMTCNFLVVLDSCCNIIVYLLTSDKFRKEFRRFIWQIYDCQLCDRNHHLTATEHLVVRQSNVLALLTPLQMSDPPIQDQIKKQCLIRQSVMTFNQIL